MSQTLYRKFRPQIFQDVIGQNHIKITLQNEIVSGQIAHAYLFTGPRGIGKTSLARIMAKSLNCENRKEKEAEPCNDCNPCKSITTGNSFDIIEIDAATHTQVDKVRDNIIENINFPPHGKYKVFIIDEVHMLSTAAFNALLKTLEEPPSFVVFILCTTEANKLPETIISRCQRFDFKKVSAELIASKLKKIIAEEKINIQNDVLQTIALRSGGFIRDAESLLGQVVALIGENKKEITMEDTVAILPRSDWHSVVSLAESLIDKNSKMALEIINKLIDDGVDLERFNLDAMDYFRKMILVKMNLKNLDESIFGLGEEIIAKLGAQAEKISWEFLKLTLDKIINNQILLKDAEIPQLPLELMAVELCEYETENKQFKNLEIKVNEKESIVDRFQEGKKNNTETNTYPTPQPNSRVVTEKKESEPLSSTPLQSQQLKNISVSLDEIKNKWLEIIKASQEVNHSLPLILKTSYPMAINGPYLEVGSEFEIHVQKFKSHQCLDNAEQIFSKIIGSPIRLKPINISHEQAESLRPEMTNNQPPIPEIDAEEIAKSFGGKVIE